jgi:hypothetical protein
MRSTRGESGSRSMQGIVPRSREVDKVDTELRVRERWSFHVQMALKTLLASFRPCSRRPELPAQYTEPQQQSKLRQVPI